MSHYIESWCTNCNSHFDMDVDNPRTYCKVCEPIMDAEEMRARRALAVLPKCIEAMETAERALNAGVTCDIDTCPHTECPLAVLRNTLTAAKEAIK